MPEFEMSLAQPKHGAPVQYSVAPSRSSGEEKSSALASAWMAMQAS
jgi:hypothetical protein